MIWNFRRDKKLQETPAHSTLTSKALPTELLGKVRYIEIVTNRLVDEIMAGSYHSSFKGRGMEFEEVREYFPGDDVRAIDWNVTARSGTPHIKRFKEERELTVMLVVDVSGSTTFGSGEQTKAELAAELCALLAFSAIRNNDRVGLLIFSDKVEHFIPPKKGKNHVLRVIREILAYRPELAPTHMPRAAEHLIKVLRKKSVVFLISDFLGEDPTKLRRPLSVLSNYHDLVALRVTDPRELEIPAMGYVQFEDPETGKRIMINTNQARFREAYAKAFRESRDQMDNLFRQLRIDLADVRLTESYIEPIVQLFRRRATRY